ncbi:MAG TPA: lipocalin family protein [Fulvivirga sp.]|nr:lipocalin family protein [Fulvivirga sp.]
MKTRILTIIAFISIGSLASCSKDDEPAVNPLIGEWQVDEFELTDIPAEFSNVAGSRSTLYGENRYRIEFNADFTYKRELRFSGGDLDEEGEWTQDGDNLELDPETDSGLINEFEIVEIDAESLTLSSEETFILLPNNVQQDTVTSQASLDALFDEYGVSNFVTVLMKMDKR